MFWIILILFTLLFVNSILCSMKVRGGWSIYFPVSPHTCSQCVQYILASSLVLSYFSQINYGLLSPLMNSFL